MKEIHFITVTQGTHISVPLTDTKVSQNIYSYSLHYFLILSILFCSIKWQQKMLGMTHKWIS